MVNQTAKQIKGGILSLVFIGVIGTIGYSLIEDMPIVDAMYMTVITISTTGYGEVKPLSESGRIFTIFLIITGVFAIAYSGGKAAQFLIETQVFRRRRMSKKISELKNHYIVCGYGRMGVQICEGLLENNSPFIVIENNPDKIEKLEEKGFLYVAGDATNDETLLNAGIKKAKGVVAVIKTDADNVFTTLSAKEHNPKVYIVVRAIDEGTESKLIKAGANRVVKPYELGGNRMVQLLLRPGVIDFIDGVARNTQVDIGLEEIPLGAESKLIGLTLAGSPIRKELNIIIVAISRIDGKFIYNPTSTTKFAEGDKLIAIGEKKALAQLDKYCNA
ncbi:potassium channel family protein [Bacteroidota bacterium]